MKAFSKIVVGTISAVLMLAVCIGSDTQALTIRIRPIDRRPLPVGVPVRPVGVPVRPVPILRLRRVPCGSIDCRVPVRLVVCDRPTCAIRANLFVRRKLRIVRRSTRLAANAQALVLFASRVANVPRGTVMDILPRLTPRGRAIARSNRGRLVRGRLVIEDAIAGGVFSSQPVAFVPR